jgi:hypothetical protein
VFKEFITNVIGIDTNNTYRTKMKGYVDNSINKSKGFKPVREDYIPFNEMPEMYDALYK